jgi:hypothetical protein
MRRAIILLVLWLLVSAFWVQFVHSTWREAVDRNLATIAAIDRCSVVFPPRPDGYASEAGNSWSVWEANKAVAFPECSPAVGSIGFLEFVAMQAPQRLAARQKAEDENRSATRGAIVAGAVGPPVLFLIGLLAVLLGRALRSR